MSRLSLAFHWQINHLEMRKLAVFVCQPLIPGMPGLAEQGGSSGQVACLRWEDEQTPFTVLGLMGRGCRGVSETQSPAAQWHSGRGSKGVKQPRAKVRVEGPFPFCPAIFGSHQHSPSLHSYQDRCINHLKIKNTRSFFKHFPITFSSVGVFSIPCKKSSTL